jgi:hypothetical protein
LFIWATSSFRKRSAPPSSAAAEALLAVEPDDEDAAAAAPEVSWPIIEFTIELKALPLEARAAPAVVDDAGAAAEAALETAPVWFELKEEMAI